MHPAKLAQDTIGYLSIRFSVADLLINQFITSHYIQDADNAMNFYTEVMSQPNFNFNLKFKIFKLILDRYYPDIAREFPYRHLRRMQEHRNIFAHSGLNATSEEAFDDINQIMFKKGLERIPFVRIRDEFIESDELVQPALENLPGVNREELITGHYERAVAAKQASLHTER